MADLTLTAPLRGWASPLDEVDDPVFAGRMLGDGVAIDPTGSELRAPCDGAVISVHAAGHAVSLRATNGAEMLLHIGLETVSMAGEGFARHVEDGQAIRRGDLLISFDLDLVAAKAKSLITPLVITNGDDFAIVSRVTDRRVEVGDPLLVVRGGEAATRIEAPASATASRAVTVPLAHGLHARPAALVAAEAKRHRSDIALSAGGRSANAKSPVAIMALGLGHDAEVVIEARGEDAQAAVAALADLIAHRLPPEPPPAAPAAPTPTAPKAASGWLKGTPAAPGLAIGPVARLIAREVQVREQSMGAEAETLALSAALGALRARLTVQSRAGPRERRDILAAHLAFLDDEEMIAAAEAGIAGGRSAGAAWRAAIRAQVEVL
ncbi:MAG: glucose PTS transporter subunit IIA, partial [Caulobacteraceae bacterium]